MTLKGSFNRIFHTYVIVYHYIKTKRSLIANLSSGEATPQLFCMLTKLKVPFWKALSKPIMLDFLLIVECYVLEAPGT